MRHIRVQAAGALVALLVLAACATVGGGRPPTAPFDRQFIDMMVPHHQGAVEMARIAYQRAEHPEIKAMAGDVIAAQDEEIARMKGWRRAWYGSDETPPMDTMPMVPGMDSGHAMGGAAGGSMDMAANVAKLRAAGAPFDQAFVDAMIPHHESAIAAAKAAEMRAERAEIKDLARQIVAAQQREIDQMKGWRLTWYGSATP